MTAVAAPTTRRSTKRGRALEIVGLALLAYVPFLLSSPGKVSADSHTYLYLDPGRFLSRAPYLWDGSSGFGTVSHQQIGFLVPMGPYFWAMDVLGMPDWIAQRLWLGSLSFLAALGARWLFRMLGARRVAALAAALVYMLTPYQVSLTAAFSVLLLPWAALPWLVGLTMRAVRRGGWGDPALIALVLLVIGGTNASSLVFVLIAPALWLVMETCGGARAAGAALRAAGRIAVLGIAVSVWWIVGLRTQGAYGLPILQLTETLRTVAASTRPTELLRGLGNWLLYGKDHLDYFIDQGARYAHDDVVGAATLAIPVSALAVAGWLRWRYRAYFLLLVVVGTVVGVGAWPYDDPSPLGSLFKSFANTTSAGLALRNTPRVVPIIVLGLAGVLAAGITALGERSRTIFAAAVVVALAVVALLPVWQLGYLSGPQQGPESIPASWQNAAAALQRGPDTSRVLELPGSSFSAYRWGTTIEPVTPGLMDRPYVSRAVLPSGTPPSFNLLDALDHRLQEGTFEPSSLAAYARLVGVGTIVLRSDLKYERFDSPRPRIVWNELTDPLPSGIAAPTTYGAPVPNRASSQLPMLDPLEMSIPANAEDPPPVALFEVVDAVPIVHAAPSAGPVLIAGDGDGIVDAAAAGLIDGNQLVLESAPLDRAEIKQILRAGADVVLTDSNRRRSHDYFSRIRETSGYTQRAGQQRDRTEMGFTLDPFTTSRDATRTVVEQLGARVDATGYALNSDRPANAFDGDTRTAWRVGGRAVGEKLVLRPDTSIRTDHVTLSQPPGERDITKVRLHFDGGETIDVDLGADSISPVSHVVEFPARDIRKLTVEILGVAKSVRTRALPAVGFTEIGVGDVRVNETVRLPVDVSERLAGASQGHRIDVVISRLRSDPSQFQDEELAISRRVVVPDTRLYQLSGTARLDPNAPDAVIDSILGTTAPGSIFTSSDHLVGDADARASRAFDGNSSTAWIPNFGSQGGRWIDVSTPAPTTVDHIDLTVATDDRHSVPTQFTLAADGVPLRTFTISPHTGTAPGSQETMTVPFEPITGRQFRLTVDAVAPKLTRLVRGEPKVVLPVSISEIGLEGVAPPASASAVDSGCRDDLVRADDTPVPVRIVGPAAAARRGLAIEPCGGPVTMTQGSNSVVTGKGLDSGYDVDRLVLSSNATGSAAPPEVLGTPLDKSGATVRITSSTPDSYHLEVRSDGRPFWLVLGESHNDGWEASASSGRVGSLQLVNGFANGWLVTPDRAGTIAIDLEWTPQRFVWVGLAISAVAAVGCALLVAVTWRRRRRRRRAAPPGSDDEGLEAPPTLTSFSSSGATVTWSVLAAVAIGGGIIVALFSRPWIGAVVAVSTLVALRLPRGRVLLAAGPPLALALAGILHIDELAWLAIGLLVAGLTTCTVARQEAESTP
jgi:arabinofuranan 3-O-arabinosyltransferase